ncbi:MAG: beta-galactosidase [Verrucomicrobia bacterium]|nr:beta-galactosidase [Verrucomicrobiota bacterium]
MKKRILVGLTVVFSGMAAYAGLVNDARFVNQDWAVDMRIEMARLDGSSTNRVGFNVDTGENGQAPSVSDGTLKVTMEGATGGMTQLKSVGLGTYAFHAATNYVVTTRMRVTQFPDDDFDPTVAQSSSGINVMDIRGFDRTWIALQPDGVWVNGGGSWNEAASIATAENTWYTWQFEVTQVPGAGAGTVDIYRRLHDTDSWTTVATGVGIRDQDAADQLLLYRIYHNDDNTQTQGAIEVEYLHVGMDISSPAGLAPSGSAVRSGLQVSLVPEDWELPGTTLGEIAKPLTFFSERIQTAIHSEARYMNKHRNIIPLSIDGTDKLFSDNLLAFEVLPSPERADGMRVVCQLYPYITRYVPSLLRKIETLSPVWEESRALDSRNAVSFSTDSVEAGVYRLHVSLYDSSDRKIAERRLYVGVQYDDTPPDFPITPVSLPTDRPLLTQYYPMDVGANHPEVGVSSNPDHDFPILKEAGYDGIRIIVHWDDLEVIPGGYNFQRLDEIVKKAAEHGLSVTFFPLFQAHRIPIWLMAEEYMVDQDGEVSRSEGFRFKMVPNLFSEKTNQGYRDLMRQIVRRYDSFPHVIGYHLSLRAVEWGFAGAAFREQSFDYSEASRVHFRRYLEDQGHTLESLSERHGEKYTSWECIDLPLPRFFETDPSWKWHDFNEFKMYGLRYVADALLTSVREQTDKFLTLYNYGGFGPVENMFDLLKKHDAFGGICSAQTFYFHVVNDMYRRSGLRMYIEPAGLDPNRPEGALFSKLHAGRILHDAGGIVNFPNLSQTVPTKQHFDSMIHVLDHAHNDRPVPRIGIHVSYRSIIDHAKSFTGNFYWDWRFYKSFIFGLQYTGATVEYFTDFTDHALDKYDLVIDAASQLISDRDVERLGAYVANGGKLVLFPESGRYILGRATPSHFAERMGLEGLRFEGNKRDTTADWNGYAAQFNDGYVLGHTGSWTPVLTSKFGETLVARRELGKGSVMVLGGYPSLQRRWRGTEFAVNNVSFFKALLSEAGLLNSEPLLALEPRPVRSMIFQKNGDIFVALVNDNKEWLDVRYRVNGIDQATGLDLVSERSIEISNHVLTTEIGPHALMVIQFQGRTND